MVTINAGSSRAIASRKKASASRSFRLVMKSGAGREAPRRERHAQHVDRRGIGREQHGAIEDDGNHGLAGRQHRNQPIDCDGALARQITGQARHRFRLAQGDVASGMARQTAQQRAHIGPATLAKILQQRSKLVGRQRRGGFEPHIVAVLARQHGQRRCRARAPASPSRSTPYFHQSNPPRRRIRITLAWAPTRSIHKSTDIG